jgi:hypothetical protein
MSNTFGGIGHAARLVYANAPGALDQEPNRPLPLPDEIALSYTEYRVMTSATKAEASPRERKSLG